MHCMHAIKTYREKCRRELHKNATYRFEFILEATSHKTTVVLPFSSHLTNHPNKTNKTHGQCWRSKDELISDVLLWTPTHGRTSVGRPARTYICTL